MKKWVSLLPFLFFLLIASHSFGQEIGTDAKSPQHQASSGLEKKALKKKEAQKAKIAKGEEMERKHQYKIQTRAVKKRMKESKKQSERVNENKKESFFKRLFKKKQR